MALRMEGVGRVIVSDLSSTCCMVFSCWLIDSSWVCVCIAYPSGGLQDGSVSNLDCSGNLTVKTIFERLSLFYHKTKRHSDQTVCIKSLTPFAEGGEGGFVPIGWRKRRRRLSTKSRPANKLQSSRRNNQRRGLIMAEMLWKPSDESIRQSNMHRFMQFINSKYNQKFTQYAPLYAWSVRNIPDFWASLWEFADIIHSKPYDQVVDDLGKMPGARWFSGAHLNFAENLLRHRDGQTALIFKGEGQPSVKITYAQLYDEVARIATSLRAMGIKPGDRVVGFLPNMPQAIIAMLAATSIGAIWSSCSPDFGIKGVLDRFGQIQPRVIFTADGYFFKGKKIDSLERMAEHPQGTAFDRTGGGGALHRAGARHPGASERRALGGFSGHGSRPADPVRATALRASALHHVLLRHHGSAEVHGAERGRHPRPPSEGVDAAHQPHPRRHHLLLHHLRLDDVELADEFAGGGRDPGALRRQPLPSRTPARCGRWPRTKRSRFSAPARATSRPS